MKYKLDKKMQMVVDILKTADCIDSIVSETLKPYKITHPQFNILRILNGALPSSLYVGDIKERLLFSKSDVTRILDRMIKRGIIERKVCENNRRRVEISINENGLELLSKTSSDIEVALQKNKLAQIFKDKEVENVSQILNQLRMELQSN